MIIWNNFQRGQCSSPYILDGAYSKAANIDVHGQRGIARIEYLPIKGTDPSGLAVQISKDPAQTTHAYASVASVIYKSTNSGATFATTSGGTGNYFEIWKDYLLSFGGTDIDYYGALSSSPTWSADWQTDLENTTEHFAFVSRNDDKVYVCNDRYVATIEEVAAQNFHPTASATYTYTTQALTLPEGYAALCLAEQRENILVGAIKGQSAGPVQEATVFIWDREKNEYDYHITVPENAINAMYSLRDQVFVSAGKKGRIYRFTEAGLVPFVQLPFDYDAGAEIDVRRHGMGEWRGKLVVGTESLDGLNPAGVFLIDIDTREITPAITPSTGGDGTSDDLYIGSVLGFNTDILLFGWQDNNETPNDYGIDYISEGNASQYRRTSYGAYIESPFFRVGTETNRGTFRNVEIHLARKLQTGEGIKLYYRENINDSWTQLGKDGTDKVFDFTTFGAHASYKFPVGIHEVRNLQLRAELTTGASSTNTPYLLEIRLY